MKDHSPPPEAIMGGAIEQYKFGMRDRDFPHVFALLRGALYSRRIRAVLREYSANGWDEHRRLGLTDLPIKVVLPTSLNLMCIIRDYGEGLSPEQVREFVANIGASDKRDSDAVVGSFGLGFKSGFAYSSSFTITSYNKGRKYVFLAVIGASECGDIQLTYVGETEETGIEIAIPVAKKDIAEFHTEARDLFQYMVPKPVCNIEIPDPVTGIRLESAVLTRSNYPHGSLIAVMGCVPYPLGQLPDELKWPFSSHAGRILAPIGAFDVPPSRENVSWTDRSRDAFAAMFAKLEEEVVSARERALASYSGWARLQAQRSWQTSWDGSSYTPPLTYRRPGAPPASSSLDGDSANYFYPFQLMHYNLQYTRGSQSVTSSPARTVNFSKLYWPDADPASRQISGCTVVMPTARGLVLGSRLTRNKAKRPELERAFAEIEALWPEFCELNGITGVPLLKVSDLPLRRVRGVAPEHARKSMFRVRKGENSPSAAEDWEAVDEIPEGALVAPIDRYVLYGVQEHWYNIRQVYALFKQPLPELYGIKYAAYKKLSREEHAEFCSLKAHLEDLRSQIRASPRWRRAALYCRVFAQARGWIANYPDLAQLGSENELASTALGRLVRRVKRASAVLLPEAVSSAFSEDAGLKSVPTLEGAYTRFLWEWYPLLASSVRSVRGVSHERDLARIQARIEFESRLRKAWAQYILQCDTERENQLALRKQTAKEQAPGLPEVP